MTPIRKSIALLLALVVLPATQACSEDRPLAVVNSTPVHVCITLLSTKSATSGFTRHSTKKRERHSNDYWKFPAKEGA